MPVSGDHRPQRARTRGSIARTAEPLSGRSDATPLAAACPRSCSSFGSSSADVATISLPMRACGTPCAAHHAYRSRLPAVHSVALRLPGA